MKKKRGNNEGSIGKHGNRWRGQYTRPDGTRGAVYGGTRAEAASKLHDALQAQKENLPIPKARLTVEQYLNNWLTLHESRVKARTFLRYQQFTNNIIAVIGKKSLAKLSPQEIEGLYDHYRKAGMAPNTLNHLHNLFHLALDKALRLGLIAYNPCDRVDAPPPAHDERPTWTIDQARHFLEVAADDPLEALYTLELYTGMRQGELLALKWPQVDLKAQTIEIIATLSKVHGQFLFTPPKTKRSQRTIHYLPRQVIESLQAHYKRQLQEKMRLRDVWDDSYNLVFPNSIGRPIESTHLLRRSFYPLVEQAGLPKIHFHDLRQTVSDMLKRLGVSTDSTAEVFGHENRYITDQFYGHEAPELQKEAMEKLEQALAPKEGTDSDTSTGNAN